MKSGGRRNAEGDEGDVRRVLKGSVREVSVEERVRNRTVREGGIRKRKCQERK